MIIRSPGSPVHGPVTWVEEKDCDGVKIQKNIDNVAQICYTFFGVGPMFPQPFVPPKSGNMYILYFP